MIKVLVNGAFGRMGSEVVRMVTANPELELVGGVDINAAGKSLPDGKPVFTNIGEALEAVKADVVVDFTRYHFEERRSRCSRYDRFYR